MSGFFAAIVLISMLLTFMGTNGSAGIERTSVAWPTKQDALILYSRERTHLLLVRQNETLEEIRYDTTSEARALAGVRIADLVVPATTRATLPSGNIQNIYVHAVKEMGCGKWKLLKTGAIRESYKVILSESPKCTRKSIISKNNIMEFDFQSKKDAHRTFGTF